MAIDVGAAADKGRVRRQNEDRYAVLLPPNVATGIDLVIVVADGMGGSQAGEIASAMVVDHVAREVSPGGVVAASNGNGNFNELLKQIIRGANQQVRDMAQDDRRRQGMGSTVTAAILASDRLHVGHVGDSRAYLVCGDTIHQISNDHSWVADQVRAGQLTTDEALGHPKRHYITRFVGGASDLLVDTAEVAMSAGDRLLVCTDGLTNLVTDVELLECIKSFGQPAVAAEKLVALANQRGGDDDVTVVVAHVVDSSADGTSTVPTKESGETRPLRLGRISSLAIGGLAILSLLSMWSAATDQSLWSIAGNLIRTLIRRGIS